MCENELLMASKMTRANTEQFNDLKKLILDQVTQLREIVLTKDDLNDIFKKFETEIAKRDDEIFQLKNRLVIAETAIDEIKHSQNAAEQYSRRQSLRLTGVPKHHGETAEDCLDTVRGIIDHPDIKLDIPDSVLDRAHRIGSGKDQAIIFKLTTWRHRTMIYRKRQDIYNALKYKVTLDITRPNMRMMDELRSDIKANPEATNLVNYIFCDNPTE